MRRSLLQPVLSMLVVSSLALGCGIFSNESGAGPSDSVPASSVPTTSSESDPSTADTTATTRAADGDTGALCKQLKVIADADLEMSATVDRDKVGLLAREWPTIAATYDEAITLASPDLADDLRAIKRVSELVVDILTSAGGTAEMSTAVRELTQRHQEEVLAGAQASIRANRFTEDSCGFSLNNE